jgi:multidrug efflux system outer membrane protein
VLVAFQGGRRPAGRDPHPAGSIDGAGQGGVVGSSGRRVLSDTRYRNGYISQLDLLDARRSELRNRRQALQVKSAQYQAAVGLIRAIGGSWEAPASVASAPGAATAQQKVATR